MSFLVKSHVVTMDSNLRNPEHDGTRNRHANHSATASSEVKGLVVLKVEVLKKFLWLCIPEMSQRLICFFIIFDTSEGTKVLFFHKVKVAP